MYEESFPEKNSLRLNNKTHIEIRLTMCRASPNRRHSDRTKWHSSGIPKDAHESVGEGK
jgi:hypothetical protein